MANGYEDALALQCRLAKMPEPVREYCFHPTRKWRFDLCWPDMMLAVEVDGGAFTQGRHNRPMGFLKDMEKMNEATLLGWRILRVTPAEVGSGEALNLIERAFQELPKVWAL